jgi:hypothetical protein
MTPLKKGQTREEECYMSGCGLRPHPYMYPSRHLECSFSVHSSYFLEFAAGYPVARDSDPW